jgi:uncharacterized protein (TIGR04255 family)
VIALARFKSAPIHEVVFGVSYDPQPEWTIGHLGSFWTTVKDRYPECRHALPVGDGELVDRLTGLPLPRVWFVNKSNDELLQLQSGRFWRNWRNANSGVAYPEYDALSNRFAGDWRLFNEFCTTEGLQNPVIKRMELSYINHIYPDENVSIANAAQRIFPLANWNEGGPEWLSSPKDFRLGRSFSIPDGVGSLSATVTTAVNNDTKKSLIVFELKVLSELLSTPPKDPLEWFNAAHEHIIQGFCGLTTEWAQIEKWERCE